MVAAASFDSLRVKQDKSNPRTTYFLYTLLVASLVGREALPSSNFLYSLFVLRVGNAATRNAPLSLVDTTCYILALINRSSSFFGSKWTKNWEKIADFSGCHMLDLAAEKDIPRFFFTAHESSCLCRHSALRGAREGRCGWWKSLAPHREKGRLALLNERRYIHE
jgi:hypothetical protein